ncbi:MAG: helix-turn-helix transcriptional regulator [Veillonella dispar]|nr:helix-turn-helix transcriptional regulator [Veillonella dispar]
MDPLRILKALSNPHRLDIILWLKHPEKEFGVQVHTKTLIDFPNSVSVKSIQKRCGVSQSSISTFMSILENAELVESRKIDQYTYFRRNEKVILEFGEWYNKEVSIQSDDIDKLLETVNLEDTSYPTTELTEETSVLGEQLAAEINTKGSDHDENRK